MGLALAPPPHPKPHPLGRQGGGRAALSPSLSPSPANRGVGRGDRGAAPGPTPSPQAPPPGQQGGCGCALQLAAGWPGGTTTEQHLPRGPTYLPCWCPGKPRLSLPRLSSTPSPQALRSVWLTLLLPPRSSSPPPWMCLPRLNWATTCGSQPPLTGG